MYRHLCFIGMLTLFTNYLKANTWEDALLNKNGTLDIYWFTSSPFIYQDDKDQLTGLEYEIIESFRRYLKKQHQISLTANWIEAESFNGIIDHIKQTDHLNTIGVSAFSITEERKQYLNFTSSYLPDITVLISSQGTPIINKYEDVNTALKNMVAFTIQGTIYESLLLELKSKLKIDFEMRYIHSDQNVLDHISKNPNGFGFIDLPIYMMWIKKGSPVVRQNFFTVRGTGYGFIMPLESQWHVPFDQFLADPTYKKEISTIVSKYMGVELYEFIDNLLEGELLGTSILTKEKEIQLEHIKNANLKLEKEQSFKQLLMIGISVTLVLLIVIGIFYYQNQKTTQLLLIQKEQIEAQQEDIQRKNDMLMNRNAQLINLNEDKNNIVSILAHDLRAPLGNIIGLSSFLQNTQQKLTTDESSYVIMISDTANKMNQMITKILNIDTLEGKKNIVIKEKVNILQVLNDVSLRYKNIASQKNITLEIVDNTENQNMDTDHLLLYLVLENLVSNAIKFSPTDTLILMEANRDNDKVVFKIIDQGPGFTEDDKLLLFNRFQKLSASPTGNETSTGLGLSIVKKYVSDLNGKIWLESESGYGSTFYVSIPIS